MPITEWEEIKGGLKDFKMDNLNITYHAKKRCKERNIPLEDLRKSHGKAGKPILVGKTVVTAISNNNIHENTETDENKNVEIMMVDPEIYKFNNNYIAKIRCPENIIGHIIGKSHRHINNLKTFINGNIYLDNAKFVIETNNVDDTLMMYNILEIIINTKKLDLSKDTRVYTSRVHIYKYSKLNLNFFNNKQITDIYINNHKYINYNNTYILENNLHFYLLSKSEKCINIVANKFKKPLSNPIKTYSL